MLIRPILSIAIGAVMIVVPMFMAQVTAVLIGIFFILYGLLLLMTVGITVPTEKYVGWILGVIFLVVGAITIVFNEQAVNVIAIIFAIMLIVFGAFSVIAAIRLRKAVAYVIQP